MVGTTYSNDFILFSDNANGGLRVSWVVLQLKKLRIDIFNVLILNLFFKKITMKKNTG
jgi:hypothetical protein